MESVNDTSSVDDAIFEARMKESMPSKKELYDYMTLRGKIIIHLCLCFYYSDNVHLPALKSCRLNFLQLIMGGTDKKSLTKDEVFMRKINTKWVEFSIQSVW